MPTFLDKLCLTISTYSKSSQYTKRLNNPEEIIKSQNQRLQKLVKYSYENIKYYRELFDEYHIVPDEIKSKSELVKIPVLTKDIFRSRFWDFLPSDLPGCRIRRTSGSTGVPVCILSDTYSRMHNSAAVIRYRRQLGMHFYKTPILTLLKNQQEGHKEPHWTFLQGLHKTYYINPYSTLEEEINYSAQVIKKLKQPAIIGITPAIRTLAYRIRDSILPSIKPCAVLTNGEHLSIQVRELLEGTFHTKVTDIYACSEAGDIAWQCGKDAFYHINADNCIIEILADDKPVEDGQIGEVAITNLNRYSMPFIRYKNGDLARFGTETCSCGCKLPVLSEIIGRTGDDIYLPGGRMIPWNHIKGFMNHPDIRQFQLIQEIDGEITIKFVAEKKRDIEQIKNTLAARFNNLIKNKVTVNFSIVEKIDPGPNGKSKLVISKYTPDCLVI